MRAGTDPLVSHQPAQRTRDRRLLKGDPAGTCGGLVHARVGWKNNPPRRRAQENVIHRRDRERHRWVDARRLLPSLARILAAPEHQKARFAGCVARTAEVTDGVALQADQVELPHPFERLAGDVARLGGIRPSHAAVLRRGEVRAPLSGNLVSHQDAAVGQLHVTGGTAAAVHRRNHLLRPRDRHVRPLGLLGRKRGANPDK